MPTATARRAQPYEEFHDLTTTPLDAHWTGDVAVPAIGARVHVQGYGPGTVSAYMVWSHELRARVELDTRPDTVTLPVMTDRYGAYLYATAHDLTPAPVTPAQRLAA